MECFTIFQCLIISETLTYSKWAKIDLRYGIRTAVRIKPLGGLIPDVLYRIAYCNTILPEILSKLSHKLSYYLLYQFTSNTAYTYLFLYSF